MCCAWVAQVLVEAGYAPEDSKTQELVERWRGAANDAFLPSKSVEYLRKTGQTRDLEFILEHFNDLRAAFAIKHDEVTMVAPGE